MWHAGLDEAQAEIKIASRNMDSSLCFFQSSFSHDVLCIEVK